MKVTKNAISFIVSSPDAPGIDGFWSLLEEGTWEADTFRVFDQFLDKDRPYLDIGAWIGPTVLYGCQRAKHCYAVEPDPEALKILETNIGLNPGLAGRITLYKGCIGDSSGAVRLGSNTDFGDSMSSLLFSGSDKFLEVQSLTFDDFIRRNKIDDPNFIKMDIEGGEVKVLPTMRRYLEDKMPTLFLSLHPFFFEDRERDCRAIIEVLKIYPHIYRVDGRKIRLGDLYSVQMAMGRGNFSIIATAKWGCVKRMRYACTYAIRRFVEKKIMRHICRSSKRKALL